MIVRIAGMIGLAVVSFGCVAADDDENAGDSGDTTAERGCEAETRDDEYRLGMEKAGNALRVRFVDAMPAPPDRGDNTWQIEVLDLATGMPRDDVSLEVEPFMIDHMHGTSIECHVTELPMPGQLELAPVNLWMPGLWEIRLHFTLPDDALDEIDFRFCVDP